MTPKNINFGFLGDDFQEKLIAQIISDNRFGQDIISIIRAEYFDNMAYKNLIIYIKDYYDKYVHTIPSFNGLTELILAEEKDTINKLQLQQYILKIKEKISDDVLSTQSLALNFCKQQELQKAINKIGKILDNGSFESYDQCENLIRKALEIGNKGEQSIEVLDDIALVLNDDFRHPIPTGIQGIDDEIGGGLGRGELALFLAAMGVGKAQPLDCKIYTPSGHVLMGDIKVGDTILGSNGKVQEVVGVFPQEGLRPVYEVLFNDGTKTKCDENHLWSVQDETLKYKRIQKNNTVKTVGSDEYLTKNILEIKNNLKYKDQLRYSIPVVKPLEYDIKPLELDPYLMGIMLGDGSMGRGSFVTTDLEIIELAKIKYNKQVSVNNRTRSILNKELFEVMLFDSKNIFRKINLFDKRSDTKFIPENYLVNSIKNRVELLQGLLDSDGYIAKSGSVTFSTASIVMAKQVRELVLSLGGFSKIKTKQGKYRDKNGNIKITKLSYIVSISFTDLSIIPFKLTRKLINYKCRDKYKNAKLIKEVNYLGTEQTQCIMVSNADHLYITDDYILTHNTTWLTKCANHASNMGFNVIQIVFEDAEKIIQRKHLACWSGVNLYDLNSKKDYVLNKLKDLPKNRGKLIIKRFPSDRTNVNDIRNFIRKVSADGHKPDLVVLDYMDCVHPVNYGNGDQTANEGTVVRQLESMCAEYDFALWSALQGNRCLSLDTLVDTPNGKVEIGKITIGDKVLTHNGFKNVSHVFPVEKQATYRVKTKSGKEILCSSKHRFPLSDGGLKSLNEGLKIGDKFLTKKVNL